MKPGCYTALATPFAEEGVDLHGLEQVAAFQIENGVTGILAVGTTGESPVLSWEEHNQVIERVARQCEGKCVSIAGTGSNNTRECLDACAHAAAAGADALLLVDPYYNGPSSLEIRKAYIEPVARAFPDLDVVPYVIPGRTGAQLLPEDLALAFAACPNVSTVKEATGDLENMRRTRACCGSDFLILSGDDPMTFAMMADPQIEAAGVISVISNIAPRAVGDMVRLFREGRREEAEALNRALAPLSGIVTVKTTETTPHGEVVCRARNPLGLKTLMAVLGMPAGGCRAPLGKMTRNGLEAVLAAARSVQADHPEILQPLADFFGVDIDERLNTPAYRDGLAYDAY
jgi:4-hydroxy-tetrahydrodipicolinate synthase